MVNTASVVIAATLAGPVLAAPVVNWKALGNVAKAVGHATKGGVEFGATVSSILPQKQAREVEDIEERTIHVSANTLQSIGRGAVAAAKAAKGGVEFGATVSSILPPHNKREEQDLEARRFKISSNAIRHAATAVAGAGAFAGTVAVTQTQRDFDEDLEVREPLFGAIGTAAKIAGNVAGKVAFAVGGGLLGGRELEELEIRDPLFGKLIKAVAKVAGHVASGALSQREAEEIVAREVGDDFAEVEAREPFFLGKIIKTAAKVAGGLIGGREDEEEVEMREPFFLGKIIKTAAKVAGGLIGGREDEEELEMREFDDEFEMVAREFDDEVDMEAREPFFLGKIIKTAAKVAGGLIGGRDMEIDELD